MDKRVWVALILSMAVLFFYPYFIQQFYPQVGQKTEEAQKAAPAPGTTATTQAQPAAPVAPPPVKEELTTVETPLFRAVLSSVGGSINSFELKNYKEGIEAGAKTIDVSQRLGTHHSFKTDIEIKGAAAGISFTPSRPAASICWRD